jgi:alpha-galactosidase
MVNNETARTLEFVKQVQVGNTVRTIMKTPEREIYATHILTIYPGKNYFSLNTEVENRTDKLINIDQLASFVLGMISPFAVDDGNDRYYLHRRLAFWSAEGKLKSEAIEDLGLERSYMASIGRVERFGQRSSMAVKKYFPTAVVEDRQAGVCWGVQLCAIGPWQMELVRRGDFLNLVGGMVDKEFANFEKTLLPNEKIQGIEAIVSVVEGNTDKVFNNLVEYIEDNNQVYSSQEDDMPIIYNDWFTNHGVQSEEKLFAVAETLKNRGVKYLVLDAGWFCSKNNTELNPNWAYSKGDWCVNHTRFPSGIKKISEKLQEMGFLTGIWFEMEQVNFECAEVAKEHPEYFE